MFPKNMGNPHLKIGGSILFTIHFWGKFPLFLVGNTHIALFRPGFLISAPELGKPMDTSVPVLKKKHSANGFSIIGTFVKMKNGGMFPWSCGPWPKKPGVPYFPLNPGWLINRDPFNGLL